MKNLFEIIKSAFIFITLTVLTQVGGLIYLLYKPIGFSIKKNFSSFKSYGLRILSFSFLYIILSLTVVPLIAQKFDRTPLPLTEAYNIKPGTYLTWLTNRHYVDPDLKELLVETANEKPNDIIVIYLDANFPFFDGFPLLPHLSHNDGDKVDLAFIYSNESGEKLNDVKSLFGYGVVEEPTNTEFNQPAECDNRGYWQYSFLTKLTRQNSHNDYQFDLIANSELIKTLANNPKTGKIFIEPHLKSRMNLTNSKIRFHGCQAVRHDDHIHVQL